VFARVSPYLKSDMDRHGITAAIGEARIFRTLHEALTAVRAGTLGATSKQGGAFGKDGSDRRDERQDGRPTGSR
ncbi:MAG TPA: hypothetical protein VFB75_16870, partial [Burkholderiales bacterium]|nr:hypothetical protein [Burkholderiales bacterium]